MPTNAPSRSHLLTFASGGWVILLAAFVCLLLVLWAVAPAVFRMSDRPPGDGRNVETYGFDLTTCLVPTSEMAAAMLHRDMVPVMDDPEVVSADAIADINAERRGKYIVSSDAVIGVEIDGTSRAYPISVMNVHDIVNDTLGETPIAVTYSWLSGSTRVFDREVNGDVVRFGVSGLVYNSNLLMYDRRDATGDDPAIESLWSQLQARAVTGPEAAAGTTLGIVPSTLTTWADWKTRHPSTTVIVQDPRLVKRYKHAAPTSYLESDRVVHPVSPAPPEDGLAAKTPVVAVITNDARRVYPIALVARNTGTDGAWRDTLGDTDLTFAYDATARTVTVTADPPDKLIEVVPALWFAWHAMYPEDGVATK